MAGRGGEDWVGGGSEVSSEWAGKWAAGRGGGQGGVGLAGEAGRCGLGRGVGGGNQQRWMDARQGERGG